jgi:thiamine kinase-like enzyme
MENTNAEVQEQQEVKEQQTETKEVDVNALMARLEQLESTNQRILNESKEYKTKYRSLRENVEQKEQEQLEKSENWKELLDIEKNKSNQYAQEAKQLKSQMLKKHIDFEVARLAPNAFDIGDVINNLPKEMLSINEETMEVKGIEEAVNLIKEKKSYLFNVKQGTGMAQQRPVADNGEVSFKDLDKQQQDRLFREALAKQFG